MVFQAHADYEESDNHIICQVISQCNQMQAYMITNRPLLPVPTLKNPIATQDHRTTKEDQQMTTANYSRITLSPVVAIRATKTLA